MIAPTSEQLKILVERAARHLTADEGDMLRAGVEDLQSERLTSSDPTITPNAAPSGSSTRPVTASGGEDGPFPVPSPHAGAEGLSGLPAPVPPNDVCGFVHDQWDIVRMRRRCIAPAGHTQGQFAYDHGPWERVPEPSRVTAPDAPSTPPAAPVSASQRPEVAGEPENGQDGTAGREAAPGRPARRRIPMPPPDDQGRAFDGCNRECWKAGAHTLTWGLCAHAVEPPLTVGMSVVYIDPEDGQPSIGFDRFTVAELAELIEPALREVGIRLGPIEVAMHQSGRELPLPAEQCARLALAAAAAIVTHSNRDAT